MSRGVSITWLGHGTFYIQTGAGTKILVDAWVMSNPACPEDLKGLSDVDLMLVTHGHFDHVADVVAIAERANPTVICIHEMAGWLGSKGVSNVQGMNKGGTQVFSDVSVTMVYADHSGGIDDDGTTVYGGEAVGFVIAPENGPVIYHAGDTNLFGDMKLIGELYQPEIAILPIGDLFTMSPREAAVACRLIGAKTIIPGHWGTFPLLTGTPEKLRELIQDQEGVEVVGLEPGQSY